MRVALLASLAVVCLAKDAADRLNSGHLEAVHAQRLEWMRQRIDAPLPGVYQDFRGVIADQILDDSLIQAAKSAGAQILLLRHASPETRDGVVVLEQQKPVPAFADHPPAGLREKQRRRFENAAKQYPDEAFAVAGNTLWKSPNWTVAFRHASVHVLARTLDPQSIRASLDQGRDYAAQDWLCDPSGFYFVAGNALGSFDIGDTVPLLPTTHLHGNFPIRAKIRLLKDGKTVTETEAAALDYAMKEQGVYRVEAFLTVDGEEHPWIFSNAIYTRKPSSMDLTMAGSISPAVEVQRNIAYAEGKPEDAHQLDLYLPKGKNHFPVMMFVPGGAWTGGRSAYKLFGNRFAKAGIGVAIPGYRPMPENPYPAQIEDVAAAFAWLYRNIERYGGDRSRLYLAGHSTGGHLVALLALDGDYLKKFQIPRDAIHGVIAISGLYNVGRLPQFQNADDDPSPIDHVHPESPPFLVSYCQWDYLGFPRQALDFAAALKAAFTPVKLVYVPGQGHISEIVATLKEDDPLARAILDFIR